MLIIKYKLKVKSDALLTAGKRAISATTGRWELNKSSLVLRLACYEWEASPKRSA